MRDQFRVPLRDTPDRRAAPVVAADDDPWDGELRGDARYGVGVGFEGVVFQVRGEARVAVAHGVEGDDAQTEGGQEGDLVAPSEGDVWVAVDEEDSASLGAGGGGIPVVWIGSVSGFVRRGKVLVWAYTISCR